jgi:hypothetical protein
MDNTDFQTRLADLLDQIEELPAEEKERLRRLAEETRERRERMSATVTQLQESLDYLRLSVKYLVFDLEATRRENQYLRRLLREGPGLDEREGAD